MFCDWRVTAWCYTVNNKRNYSKIKKVITKKQNLFDKFINRRGATVMLKKCKSFFAVLLVIGICVGILPAKVWAVSEAELEAAQAAYDQACVKEDQAYNAWVEFYDKLLAAEDEKDEAKSQWDTAKKELAAMDKEDENYSVKEKEVNSLETVYNEKLDAYNKARQENQDAADFYDEKVAATDEAWDVLAPLLLEGCEIEGVLDKENKTLTLSGTGDFDGNFALLDEEGNRVKLANYRNGDIWPYVETVIFKEGITGIGENVFTGTNELKVVELPESLTSIGRSAFSSCTGLASINLENVTTIGENAFWGAFDPDANIHLVLRNAAIGNTAFRKACIDTLDATGLTAVGNQAFIQSPTLTTVTFGVADDAELYQDGAFFYQNYLLTSATVIGDGLEKNTFRECTALQDVTLENVTRIGDYVFYKDTALKTITLPDKVTSIGIMAFKGSGLGTINIPENLKVIDQEAFMNCTFLTGDFDLTNLDYVGWNAFTGCSNVNSVTVSDDAIVEHSDIFTGDNGVLQGWEGRMLAILDGSFELDEAEIVELEPEGWTSAKVGVNNDTESYDGTQVTKEARWADDITAEVLMQAYYTAESQMDFVFLIDSSNSITQSGSGYDLNARLYDMQSKLIDVSEELLTTPGYDCKVAFAGFGATSYYSSNGFMDDVAEVTSFVENIGTYYENTNYINGLNKALELVKSNTGRATTVIFLSDGQPNTDAAGAKVTSIDSIMPEIVAVADEIKEAGASIFGVLQSVSGDAAAAAQEVMEAICTDGMVFTSADTEGFSVAVNNAIGAAYVVYTFTDVIGEDFELDENSIRVSAGTAEYDSATRTITWTITGMPFTVHTMTFEETLKQVDGSYPVGTFDTNAGDAVLSIDETGINSVETPQLVREETPEQPELPDFPERDPEVSTPEESAPEEDIEEEETPLASAPTETEEAILVDAPETIDEEDVPQVSAPQTGKTVGSAAVVVVLAAAAVIGLSKKRKK